VLVQGSIEAPPQLIVVLKEVELTNLTATAVSIFTTLIEYTNFSELHLQ